ncbi:MAG: TldD/PmbA family protein [Bacillales bacterium]
MISKKIAKEILNLALSTGADFAELFIEKTNSTNIVLENGKVDTVGSGEISGIGIRILKDLQSVYGHTNDLSKNSLAQLARDLSKSFSGDKIKTVDNFKSKKIKKINQSSESYKDVSLGEIINVLKDVSHNILDYDKKIVRVTNGFTIRMQDVEIYNSDGLIAKDHREYGRLFINSVASLDNKIETRFDGPGSQKGWSYFKNQLSLKWLAKNHARKLILMLSARECPSGKFPVIIGNGWGGVIFHEACGHQLEATSVAKKLSVFSDSHNQKIANECVTAYDDGTIADEWGSSNMDDEGNPTNKNLLIENGILKGYLVDPFGSRRMNNFKQNGCSRRQSYKYEPTSRMSNTYIAPGKFTPEEIIENTKFAIYAVSFNGGSVNPATGEFNFGCSEAYLVKNGKIVEPLRGATLIGKATEILKHIDMVGNDLALGQGMCGSASGSIPVNVGQPTIRIDEIIVGGRGGNINEFK